MCYNKAKVFVTYARIFMQKGVLNKKITARHIIAACIILLLAYCFFFLLDGIGNSSQSQSSLVAGVRFEGEYKIGDGNWQVIKQGEHIPSTQGDVTLRGTFVMINPSTGEPLSNVKAGTSISFYCNHVSIQIPIENVGTIKLDCENDRIGEDACAVMRGSYTLASSEQTTIIIHNPHKFGNENAVDEFLSNMSLAPGVYLGQMDLEVDESARNAGLVIIITSILIIGIAFFSSVIHIRYSKDIWIIGLMSLMAGIYILFDTHGIYTWNDSFITNTRVLGLSMMLYTLFFKMLIAPIIEPKYKPFSRMSLGVSVITIIACIGASFSETIKFYDTWAYWTICELAASTVLAITMLLSFKKKRLEDKIFYVGGFFPIAAFIGDIIATVLGTWEGGFLSKIVFAVVFIGILIVVLRIIPSHVNAAMKARELEAEQQALKLELQESKISIMLSQMQPHFIFNTLNTIYHLCEIDPQVARSTISSFSEYLRNNIDTLGQSEMISFEKELSFVKTYLDIEKVRFDDELEIELDIGVTNFKLPILTVQPIVENAVKHGTSKKKGVAQLFISTSENDDYYEICIRDTGVGFDTETYNDDGHKHIGISSVSERLKNLCDGTLTIESEVGVGTTATVKIPKKEIKA